MNANGRNAVAKRLKASLETFEMAWTVSAETMRCEDSSDAKYRALACRMVFMTCFSDARRIMYANDMLYATLTVSLRSSIFLRTSSINRSAYGRKSMLWRTVNVTR